MGWYLHACGLASLLCSSSCHQRSETLHDLVSSQLGIQDLRRSCWVTFAFPECRVRDAGCLRSSTSSLGSGTVAVSWVGCLPNGWLKRKQPGIILSIDWKMCQVILVSLDCIKTVVPYWTVWIWTWEFRKLLWRLLCRHVWRLTKQFVFGNLQKIMWW